jgi:octaprenyl-diphosphate synthase
LFEAACLSAAVSVGASEQFEKAAKDYAVALGLAFQIKDDILDYDGSEAVGKPLGVDILEQKITMPLLGAMSNVSAEEATRIRGLVADIVGHPEYRDEIVDFVKANGGIEYAVKELDKYIGDAVNALDVLPDSYEKECLAALAYFTGKRNK